MTATDVAIIVPCHNLTDGESTIHRLLTQCETVDQELSIVIVIVFDGVHSSEQERCRLAAAPACIVWLPENRGAYHARNVGIRASNSRLVALTDSDCVPDRDWLQAGVSAFESGTIDILAGAIAPALGSRRGPAAIADFAVSYDQEGFVAQGHAAAGNLWFRRSVFDSLGGFDESLAFGGDTDFTARARANGSSIAYGRDVRVRHPALNATALVRRYYRRGRALQTRVERGTSRPTLPAARTPLTARLRRASRELGGTPRAIDAVFGWLAVLAFIHLPWRVGRAVSWLGSIPMRRRRSAEAPSDNLNADTLGHSRALLAVGSSIIADNNAATVCDALGKAGVRAIVLKGSHQSMSLYGGVRRAPIDVDLLVPPGSLADAERVLTSQGYRPFAHSTPGVEGDHSTVWTAQGRFPVDLHWSIAGADPDRLWDALCGEIESREVRQSTVEVPNETAIAFISALHAAQHGAGNEQSIDDLVHALQIIDRWRWERAWTLSQRANASIAFCAGLSLAPEGCRLLEELGAESHAALPHALALSLATPPETADGFYWLSQQAGLRRRLHFLGHKLVPPRAFMRDKYAIASRGRTGLVLAYLYRPLWLAWWAPRGYLAWRRAKRVAAASRRDDRD